MSTTIEYNNQTIADAEDPVEITMKTKGKKMLSDVVVRGTSGGGSTSSNILVIPVIHDEITGEFTTTVTCGELKAVFNSRGAVMFTTTSVDKDGLTVSVAAYDNHSKIYPSIHSEEYSGTLMVFTDQNIPAFYYACNFTMGEDDNPQPLNDSDPLYIGYTLG